MKRSFLIIVPKSGPFRITSYNVCYTKLLRLAQGVMLFGDVASKINAEHEFLGTDMGEAFLDMLIQLIGCDADDGLAFEILYGGNVRQRLVAASGCKQRDIVAGALV